MRELVALALLTFGIAAMMPTRAADLVEPDTDGVAYGGGWSRGVRAAPVELYDYEPGVIVRAYWLSPWRHRHYFPVTGQRPAVGRREDLSATGAVPQPSETFYRAWSTTDLFLHRVPHIRIRARGLDDEGAARRDGQLPNAPVKP